MLQKMLNDTPPAGAGGVGWLWWLDIDTVVDPAQVNTRSLNLSGLDVCFQRMDTFLCSALVLLSVICWLISADMLLIGVL